MPPNFQQSIQNLSRYLSGLDLGSLSQENISALFKSLSGLSSSLRSFNPAQPQPTQLTSPQGGVPSHGFGMTAEGLPEPTAPQEQLQFQEGLGVSVQQAQQDFIATAERQRDEAIKRQEAINAQLMEILAESDPRKRETFAQEEKIIRDQLKAAETAASTLEEDFKTRRRIVSEMEQLLTEGNALIKQQIEKPASLRFIQKSASRTMSDVQARAGVLSAVIAGVDGNINMAHSIIGNATNAVRAQWNDVVNYNNAVLNLTNQGLLAIEAEHKKFAEIELGLAESNLARLQETEDYIKGLMTDPQTAQFIADAGISLNDSIEEINTKMAEQTKKQEIVQFQNEMTSQGYEFTPVQTEGSVSFEVGGKTMWFKPPTDDKLLSVAEAKSLGVPFGTTRSQAAAMGIIPGTRGTGGSGGVDTVDTGTLSPTSLNVLEGVINLEDLTPTRREAVTSELRRFGLFDSTPAQWFTEFIEEELQMNLTTQALKQEWDNYRKNIIGGRGGGGADEASLRQRALAGGYDFDALKAQFSLEDIDQALTDSGI